MIKAVKAFVGLKFDWYEVVYDGGDVITDSGEDMILVYDDDSDGKYVEIHREQIVEDFMDTSFE